MPDDRYRTAMRGVLAAIEQSVAEMNAAQPRTTYPWWRRLWWRIVGVPRDVRVVQLRENKRRAELLLAALHRCKSDLGVTSTTL